MRKICCFFFLSSSQHFSSYLLSHPFVSFFVFSFFLEYWPKRPCLFLQLRADVVPKTAGREAQASHLRCTQPFQAQGCCSGSFSHPKWVWCLVCEAINPQQSLFWIWVEARRHSSASSSSAKRRGVLLLINKRRMRRRRKLKTCPLQTSLIGRQIRPSIWNFLSELTEILPNTVNINNTALFIVREYREMDWMCSFLEKN